MDILRVIMLSVLMLSVVMLSVEVLIFECMHIWYKLFLQNFQQILDYVIDSNPFQREWSLLLTKSPDVQLHQDGQGHKLESVEGLPRLEGRSMH